jgi:hypothetical protein
MSTWQPILGTNTATPLNLSYRVGRFAPYRTQLFTCSTGPSSTFLMTRSTAHLSTRSLNMSPMSRCHSEKCAVFYVPAAT